MYPITKNDRRVKETPTDQRKIPDLINFCIVKGIITRTCKLESCHDFAEDHSSFIITIYSHINKPNDKVTLSNKHSNWEEFKTLLERSVDLNVPLNTPQEINNEVWALINNKQSAASAIGITKKQEHCPIIIIEKFIEKLRKRWQLNQSVENKRAKETIVRT